MVAALGGQINQVLPGLLLAQLGQLYLHLQAHLAQVVQARQAWGQLHLWHPKLLKVQLVSNHRLPKLHRVLCELPLVQSEPHEEQLFLPLF